MPTLSTPSVVSLLLLTGIMSACRRAAQKEPSRQAATNSSDSGTMGAASSHATRLPMPEACSADTAQGVRVTSHCFGPMPVDSSLSFLAAHFPDYQVDTQLLETTPVLVWYYKIRDVTAMSPSSRPPWNSPHPRSSGGPGDEGSSYLVECRSPTRGPSCESPLRAPHT